MSSEWGWGAWLKGRTVLNSMSFHWHKREQWQIAVVTFYANEIAILRKQAGEQAAFQ